MVNTFILLLGVLALSVCADSDIPNDISAPELNTTDETPLTYPDAVVLLSSNETTGDLPTMEVLVSNLLGLNHSDTAHNEANKTDVEAVIFLVTVEAAELNDTNPNLTESNNFKPLQRYPLRLDTPEFIRRRRSSEADHSDALVRKKRTHYKGQQNPCMTCGAMQYMPPIVINIVKKPRGKKRNRNRGGCGHGGCGGQPAPYYPPPQPVYQPSPCGQPRCGGPPPPVYHPPPQPVYQPQPQTCNICQGQHAGGHYPSGGSYSQSSAQSSAQSSSASWGKK